jgi:hypothetical protein
MKASASVQGGGGKSSSTMTDQGHHSNIQEFIMNTKTLFAAAAVALSVVAVSAPAAQADVTVDISLGGFYPGPVGYYEDEGYYGHYRHRRHHVRPVVYGISCDAGRQEVRESGFHRVRTIECGGPSFTYTGWRHGDRYQVKVSRRSGDIIAVSEMHW